MLFPLLVLELILRITSLCYTHLTTYLTDIEPDSDVRVLYKQLMKDYIPDVRPVKRHADQLQLHVNLKLSQIIRLVRF